MARISRAYRLPVETDKEIKRLAALNGCSEADVIVRAVGPKPGLAPSAAKMTEQICQALGQPFRLNREGREPVLRPGEAKR